MRYAVAVSVLLLAAAPLAAKPVPPPADAVVGPADTSGIWREQAIAACIDTLHAVRELNADDLESICGCAASAAIEENGAGMLPPVERGQFPPAMRGRLSICTAQIRPSQTGDVMRVAMAASQGARPSAAAPSPPADVKPTDDVDLPRTTDNGGGGFWEWVRSLRLPDWLTGAGALLWVALGILVFGLLALKIRSRDPRGDLTGPPPSMRRGAPPQPPRRPDLPR
jgi:hypothetical protein